MRKSISVYAIFNDQNYDNTLTNEIVSFEQLGPGVYYVFPAFLVSLCLFICSMFAYLLSVLLLLFSFFFFFFSFFFFMSSIKTIIVFFF